MYIYTHNMYVTRKKLKLIKLILNDKKSIHSKIIQ